MGGIPDLRTDYKAGMSLKAVSASDLAAIARFLNELEGDGAVLLTKGGDGGNSSIAVWLSDIDFSIDATTGVVSLAGANGTTLNGDTVVNGLITAIGT